MNNSGNEYRQICCIDFETANEARASACSIGMALIRNGRVVHTEEQYLRPPEPYGMFRPMNISIHGIHPEQVKDSPEFFQFFPKFQEYLSSSDLVVAHNASFDISVLRALCGFYNIPVPEIHFLCTYRASQKVWPELDNHKLNTVCNYIDYQFRHHNAESDAEAAGVVLLKMMRDLATDSPFEFVSQIGLNLGVLSCNAYSPCGCRKKHGTKRN